MFRQRLRERTSPLAFIGKGLVLLLAAALVWYGLMTLLLAVKVAPTGVNAISGYRTAFDWLAGLTPAAVDGGVTRAIVAGAGLLVFVVCGYLAIKALPRPYLARQDLELSAGDHGETCIEPRAIERLAETAAERHPAITSASSRYGEHDLSVNVTVERARDLAATLVSAQERIVSALEQHDLPAVPVNVTLTTYDRRHRRELH